MAKIESPHILPDAVGRPDSGDRGFIRWALALPLVGAEPTAHQHGRWAVAPEIHSAGRWRVCPASCTHAPVRWRHP
jgi:hypothetical protein